MVRALVLTLVFAFGIPASRVLAQGEPPSPPKPRPNDQGKPFGPDGRGPGGRDGHGPDGRGEGRGGPDGRGGSSPRFGFPGGGSTDSLNEEEKKQLRTAVERVWNDAEIVAARERIMKANEDLRTALRSALQKSDPEVVVILEKVKGVMPWDQHRGPPRLPRPEDPNFPRMAAARLGMEMMFMAKPEQRDAFRHLHEKIIALPVVKTAIDKIESAPADGRWDAYKALREVYKKECEREVAEFRAKHPEGARPPRPEGETAAPSPASTEK